MKFIAFASTVFSIAYAHENCFASVLSKRAEAEFSYIGKENPETWFNLPDSELCKIGAGEEQSPVDFGTETFLKSANDSDVPVIQWAKYKEAEFINNGNVVEVELGSKVQEQTTLTFGSASNETFVLQQFHFHDPSEHTIVGKAFPLEAHFVFESEAKNIAVFAAFFDFAAESDAGFLNQLVPSIPTSKETPSVLQELDLLAFDALVKEASVDGFFRYAGSLTTPPCSQGLKWTVLKKPLNIAACDLKSFWKAMVKNARYTQRQLKRAF